MALAFVIIAHKNPAQVERLFKAIYRPDDVVIFHFDRKSDGALHELGQRLAKEYRNVIVLRPRSIIWGGFNAAEVQLAAMEAALRANPNWHHFINLSGQDFPIKGLSRLENRLLENLRASYITWFDPLMTSLWGNARKRIERYYLDSTWLDRILRIPGLGRRIRHVFGWENQFPFIPGFRRRPPPFRYYGGSNYVILSREAAHYAVSDPRARQISRWLKHTVHPDEIFIQSILLNSPLALTVVNESLHEIEFPKDSLHPHTFTSSDLDRLLSSPKFFARKFDESRDPALLESLALHLGWHEANL
jgi:hypothetical protein